MGSWTSGTGSCSGTGSRAICDAVLRALTRARDNQVRYAAALASLGDKALSAHFDRAVVVIGRPYNTNDPSLNLCLASHLEQLGLPAVPWDMLPLKAFTSMPWENVPWHYNREQLRPSSDPTQ